LSGRINIIYEDNHLLVVEKPANMLSQADSTGDEDLLTVLKNDLKVRHNKPGNVYLGLVHRLDRPVGGVMVFAKTSKSASRLSDQIRRGVFRKTYLAVTEGKLPEKSGRLEHYLKKDNNSNMVYVAGSESDGAKKAVLDYTVLEEREGLSIVRITLHTGRPHQIRVQMAYSGAPLYGDMRYGKERSRPGVQIALWSYRIAFEHPTAKEMLEFESKPPHIYPWNLFGHALNKEI